MELAPVARRSVVDGAYDQLAGHILSGVLAPGDDLPAERQLTERLGVNRQAVREALQRLAQDGLVQIQHGGATRVRDFRRHGALHLLPQLVTADGNPDRVVIRSIIEMRACLAPDIARLAAVRALPVHVERMEEAIAQIDDESIPSETRSLVNMDLWDALVDASDNLAYRFAFNSLRDCFDPFAALLARPMSKELDDRAGRARLMAAVHAGDGAAAAKAAARLVQSSTVALTELLVDL